jgi:hypothetical protein
LRSAAVLALGAALSTVAPGLAGSAEKPFVSGSGNAYAQVYRAGPTAARLSLAPVIGLSLADYVSTVGRGETKAADWAGIGVSERRLPDNTPSLRVESTDENSEKGQTVIVAGGKDESGNGGGAIELFARATDAPLGESHVRLAGMSVPGLIEFSNGEAHTSVGVAEGKLRISRSDVSIAEVLFADTVKLLGLRWEAVQQTGSGNEKKLSGKFTIQGATIAGTPLPIPEEGASLGQVLGPINQALAPTGFAIQPPRNPHASL